MPTPGREDKSLKYGEPTLLPLWKASTQTNSVTQKFICMIFNGKFKSFPFLDFLIGKQKKSHWYFRWIWKQIPGMLKVYKNFHFWIVLNVLTKPKKKIFFKTMQFKIIPCQMCYSISTMKILVKFKVWNSRARLQDF